MNQLFNRIQKDPRHHDIVILDYQEIEERRFGGWTMGQVNLEGTNPSLLLKYSESVDLNPLSCSGKTMMALLDELFATGAITSRGI